MINFAVSMLVISGYRKDYTVKFKDGLNIILGDSDTGKSSILELINYVLGASEIHLYTELESTAKSIYLEVVLGKNIHTLKRELLDSKKFVAAYSCSYDQIPTFGKPALLSPNFASTAPDGFLSDYLFVNLGLPTVKIKVAPSKSDSEMARLSFRDIFKYMYLDQDDVGSRGMLDQKNPAVAVKNKEVFKFIFNFLDLNISELQQIISGLMQERNRLKLKLDIISDFLGESNFDSAAAINEAITELQLDLGRAESALSELSERMTSSTSRYLDVKNSIIQLGEQESAIRHEMLQLMERINKYVKLKNDYIQDIDKLKTSQKMADVSSNFELHITCPICSGPIKPDDYMKHFEKTDLSVVDAEIKFLNRRKKNIVDTIDKERVRKEELEALLNAVIEQITNFRDLFDIKTKELISPYIQERDGLVTIKSKLSEAIKHKKELLKIANQRVGIKEQIANIDDNLERQGKLLEKSLLEVKSEDDILYELGKQLDYYLDLVAIKNKSGIAISSKTYLPVVRGRDYTALTSGGLRTIVSIGYFLSILRCNIKSEISLPSFFMVDTVGKYLSKYTKKEYLDATDQSEDMNEYVEDPEKYKNIYSYMIETVGFAEELEKDCQIIIVDNDLPPKLYGVLSKDIIVEFRSDSTGKYARGLIDDA